MRTVFARLLTQQEAVHNAPMTHLLLSPLFLGGKKNGFYSYHIVVPVRLRWIKWKRRAKSEGGKKREDKQIKVTAAEVTVKEKRNGYQKVNNVTRSGTSPSRLEQWQKKNRKRARTENAEYHKEDMSKKQDTMVWKPYGRKKENIKKVKEHARKYSYSESEKKKKRYIKNEEGYKGKTTNLNTRWAHVLREQEDTHTYIHTYIIYIYIHCKWLYHYAKKRNKEEKKWLLCRLV